ncbi:MAG TPA: ferric reductase-like transmembrane domain-containing protein, partial [Micromonospora sp.]
MARNDDGELDLLPSQWLADPAPASDPRDNPEPPPRPVERPRRTAPPGPQGSTGSIPRQRPASEPRADAGPRSGRRGSGSGRRAAATGTYHRAGRLLLHVTFWSALATSVGLWWFATPSRPTSSVGELLLAGGRITGLVGGFLLLAQVLMMSRVPWLERWIGAQSLLLWHRELGGALLVVILAHVSLTIVGYARLDQKSVLGETWTVVTTYEDMISAALATGILVTVGVLAVRTVRRRMPYELWYLLHLSSYLVLLLGYG